MLFWWATLNSKFTLWFNNGFKICKFQNNITLNLDWLFIKIRPQGYFGRYFAEISAIFLRNRCLGRTLLLGKYAKVLWLWTTPSLLNGKISLLSHFFASTKDYSCLSSLDCCHLQRQCLQCSCRLSYSRTGSLSGGSCISRCPPWCDAQVWANQ